MRWVQFPDKLREGAPAVTPAVSLEGDRLLRGLHLMAFGRKTSASAQQHHDVLFFARRVAEGTASGLRHEASDALQTKNVSAFPQTATFRGIGQLLTARTALKETDFVSTAFAVGGVVDRERELTANELSPFQRLVASRTVSGEVGRPQHFGSRTRRQGGDPETRQFLVIRRCGGSASGEGVRWRGIGQSARFRGRRLQSVEFEEFVHGLFAALTLFAPLVVDLLPFELGHQLLVLPFLSEERLENAFAAKQVAAGTDHGHFA